MRVCLMIEGQDGVGWDGWLALAEACERAGLDGLFRSDHYLGGGPDEGGGALDAWATLAALGARTERIRLGTLVSPVTFRHPSALAKAVVTADHASGGRIEVGMGAGWYEREHRAYGFAFPPMPERLELLAEQVEIVHRLLSEEEVDFAGRHYRLEAVRPLPRPVQRPHPPLIVGGGARSGTLAPAVRFADEYNTTGAGPDECRRRRERLTAACERAGRDPASLPLGLMIGCLVGADERELDARLRAFAARDGGDPADVRRRLEGHWVLGTTEQALERLAAFADAGVERIYLQHLVHGDLESVELIGAELVPAAAGL